MNKKSLLIFFSLLLQIHVSNAYTKLGNGVLRSNGSASDTQAAINASKRGGTVQIPNGNYLWSSPITVNSREITLTGELKGSGGSGKPLSGGVVISNNYTGNLITINEAPGGHIVVANLQIVDGSAGPNSVHFLVNATYRGQAVLLHDCYFETKGAGVFRSIDWQGHGGVIWNCSFWSHQKDNSGIRFNCPTPWESPSTMGMDDKYGTVNTYVEDCTFTDIYLQMTDPDEAARVVLRHNKFSHSASASHGQDTGPEGCRHWEFYDNTWIFTLGATNGKSQDSHGYPLPLNYLFYVRGGTGVITGNIIPDIKSEYWSNKAEISMTVQNISRIPNNIPCQTAYPAARQVGQTWVGTGGYGFPTRGTSRNSGGPDGMHYGTDPVYIWGQHRKCDRNIKFCLDIPVSFR
jgi:hypothetical protein